MKRWVREALDRAKNGGPPMLASVRRSRERTGAPPRRTKGGNRNPEESYKYVRVVGKVAFVELTKGFTAIIDAADVPLVEGFLWKAKTQDGITYAMAGRGSDIRMHRVIMSPPADMVIDHIDGDGLNNRRSNLRICTSTENVRNSKKYTKANCHSPFKGVIRRPNGKWGAQIMRDGVKVNLGSYSTPELAARAYDMAAREYFGEFARPNFRGGAA